MRKAERRVEWKGIKGTVLRDVQMRRYTSMKVGGPVRYIIYPVNEEDLLNVIDRLKKQEIRYRFVGNGTNIIVNDSGLDEAIIRLTRIKTMRHKNINNSYKVTVSGGFSLRRFIMDCGQRGLSGLERLYWIPGTVGGGIKMNAGSFGASISDKLENIHVLTSNGDSVTVGREDASFGYRKSSIGKTECVLSAQFHLEKKDRKEILKDMDYVYRERKKRHPMDFPSSGSIFKSVSGEPAWKFIEKAGLRGTKIGDACISEKHANFIINLGSASAKDIKMLIDKTKKEVFEKLGVLLEEEVELWGFDD